MGIPDDAAPQAAVSTSAQRRRPLEQYMGRHPDIKGRMIKPRLAIAPHPHCSPLQ